MYKYILVVLILVTNIAFAKDIEVSAFGTLTADMTPEQLTKALKGKMKVEAISQSPSYVDHVQTLESSTKQEDVFYEKIKSLNAGLVDLSQLKSKWLTSKSNVLTLHLTATAVVDDSALNYQIANLRRNKRLEAGVVIAVKELEKLQNQIDMIDQKLSKEGEHGKRELLAKQREHLITNVLSESDTSTLYQVPDSTKKRLLLTHDLFTDKTNAFKQGHTIGEIIYHYFEQNLVVSSPKLLVRNEEELDISFTYGFDPLPLIGLLERFYIIEQNIGYLTLIPKFEKGSYDGDVTSIINTYLNVKVGAQVSTLTKWKRLLVRHTERNFKGDFQSPIKLYYGFGSDVNSVGGVTILSMKLPRELILNPVGLKVGKSI